MTMPNIPTETFTAVAQRNQEATTAAVRTWTEIVQNYTTSFTAEHPLPKPDETHAAVNVYFDLVTELLGNQRELVNALVDSGSSAVDTLTEQARTAADAVPFTVSAITPKRVRAARSATSS